MPWKENGAARYFSRRRYGRMVHLGVDDRILKLWDALVDRFGLTRTGRAVVLERALILLGKEVGMPSPGVTEEEILVQQALARRLTPKP